MQARLGGSMMDGLALSAQEISVVRTILTSHLPVGTRVQIFGSRAQGNAKPWSDLDLALQCEGPLPLSLLAVLAEAFDESCLPWKVDIVDRTSVSDSFASIIDGQAVLLDLA